MKNRRIFLVVLSFLLPLSLLSQVLEGVVKDKEGKAVAGATLFIREMTQGTVVDGAGCFRLSVPAGEYTCEFRSLGYESSVMRVRVEKGMPLLTVTLNPVTYMLREVRVRAKGEDPAYYIMRNAIANAPFHLNQVEKYTSDVYTKGTMRLDKVPKLLMLSTELRKEITPYIGKVFLLESMMEVMFQAPDQYSRNIVAFSSTIPDEMSPDEALGLVNVSIYAPRISGMVSPLAPGAFSYYRFRFAECYAEGERMVNKIRVEPRKRSKQLLDGWIYIVEDDWSVMGFGFKAETLGGEMTIRSVFNEIRPAVFLPTSYDIGVEVKFMGLKAGGKYYASVKYKEVTTRTKERGATIVPDALPDKITEYQPKDVSPKERRVQQQLQELESKEELSTRDAYRIARLSQELMSRPERDSLKPFELRQPWRGEKVTVDSMAMYRDSLYWMEIRTLPLKKEETLSYRQKDSLQQTGGYLNWEKDSLYRSSGKKFHSGDILWGGTYHLGKRVYVAFDGLIRAVPEYNFVDGFRIGQGIKISYNWRDDLRLTIRPSVYYTTARRDLFWQLESTLDYAPFRRGRLEVVAGDVSMDFNVRNSVARVENTVTSLIYAGNFMKFYRGRFVAFRNNIDLTNGLEWEIGGRREDRKVLMNRISYNFCGRNPKSNSPALEGGVDMPDNVSLTFYTRLNYTPGYFYRLRGRVKEYVRSGWPTFTVGYEKGIATGGENSNIYNRLDLGMRQQISAGIFDKISYGWVVGKHFSVRDLYFPDYKHFNTVGWLVSGDVFTDGFCLADYYGLYSRDTWVSGSLNYISSYLLLKRLPFMQRFMFDEGLHGRYLWTPVLKSYFECGYSVGFMENIRLGVFTGFDRKGYQGIGVYIGLPLTRKMGF